MVFESLLNNVFDIYRQRRTTDGQGGWSKDQVLVGSVDGRLRPATSAERIEAMQEQRELTHVLYVPWGTDIKRGDEVRLDELTVEVLAIREPSRASEHYEIDCREQQNEVTVEDGS